MFAAFALTAALQVTPPPAPHWDAEDRQAVVSALQPCLTLLFEMDSELHPPSGWTLARNNSDFMQRYTIYSRTRSDGARYDHTVRADVRDQGATVMCGVSIPAGDPMAAEAWLAGFSATGLTRRAVSPGLDPGAAWAFNRSDEQPDDYQEQYGEDGTVMSLSVTDSPGRPLYVSLRGVRRRNNLDLHQGVAGGWTILG